jgi:DNA-binding NtrC family response regulator
MIISSDGCSIRSSRSAGSIDVLVVDIRLPGVSGVEIADQVRQRRPGTKVVYISGEVFPAPVLKSPPGTMSLAKPFTVARLIEAIGAVLGGKASESA